MKNQKKYLNLSQRLSNKATSSKANYSILKTFLNNKKILCILPVFHDNKYVIDFREKAELSNTFFAEHQKMCYFLLENI